VLAACGTGTGRSATTAPNATAASPESTAETPLDVRMDAVDPRQRAEAGGWRAASLEPPPQHCNDQGGTEWCDGERDDDCDGLVDEGCADCVSLPCVRYAISDEEMRRGASRSGAGECVGPIFCGRIDGYASTDPPGGCGDFHCATLIFADGTARPHYCTVYGRCVRGDFQPKGFTW
jgi:hypothetical protein